MLTDREKECVKLAADGLSCKEIGCKLGISQKTVEAHLRASRLKLGARNTVNLISIAHKSGIISIMFIICSICSAISVTDFIRPSRSRVRITRTVRNSRGKRDWEIIS